jgi:hypothetical protein
MGVILCFCGSGKTYDKCCQNQSDVSGSPKILKRYEWWDLKYKERRYLEHVSVEELVERAIDIFTNITTLREDLKIGLHHPDNGGAYWMRVWSDIMSECALRNYKYPYPLGHNIRRAQISDYNWPELPDAISAFKQMNLRPHTYWVKFGKYQFLKDTLKKGEFRISAASSFNQSHLNNAQRDQELEIVLQALPSETRIEVLDRATGKADGELRPIENVKFTLKAPTDYYTCCLALTFSHRLYGDFKSDCAMIIKEPRVFLNRLIDGFKAKLVGWRGEARTVDYYDPLDNRPGPPSVYFAKHFRYWYQHEYRVVWIPPTPIAELPPLDIVMGSLEDICEIIRLNR